MMEDEWRSKLPVSLTEVAVGVRVMEVDGEEMAGSEDKSREGPMEMVERGKRQWSEVEGRGSLVKMKTVEGGCSAVSDRKKKKV